MSWQDELKELDAALAAGHISADDYRTRRDRVLSEAAGQSTGSTPHGGQTAASEATHLFEAPQKPPEPRQGPEVGDRTQIVDKPSDKDGVADRTQVVTPASHDNSADSTLVVPNSTANPQQPRFPAPPPPPPWETARPSRQQSGQHPIPEVAPPWANEDLPPEFGMQGWPRQGPEVFTEPPSSNRAKVIAIVFAVLVVLGGTGAVIWYLGFRGDDNPVSQNGDPNNPPPQTTVPPTSTKPPPDIPKGPFIELAGSPVYNRTLSMADALTQKKPTENEAKLLETNGVVEVGGLVTEDKGLRRGIWAFRVGDGGDAKAVLAAMDDLYAQAKYTVGSGPGGVTVRKRAAANPDDFNVIRAHYATDGGYMVRVEVYGKDADAVETAFPDLLLEQIDKHKPAL